MAEEGSVAGATVYVIVYGEYSSRHIVGIYSSPVLAEQTLSAIEDRVACRIEEYTVDSLTVRTGQSLWTVSMDRDGNVLGAQQESDEAAWRRSGSAEVRSRGHVCGGERLDLVATMWASDAASAVKSVNDLRVQIIACNFWIAGHSQKLTDS